MISFCLALGHALGKTLAEIGELDVEELSLWAVWLEQCDPPNELRADWRAGMIASTLANCHSSGKRFAPEDFMPQRDGEKTDPEKAMLAWCVNAGGSYKRKGE